VRPGGERSEKREGRGGVEILGVNGWRDDTRVWSARRGSGGKGLE